MNPIKYKNRIMNSGYSIYDTVDYDSKLYIPNDALEELLYNYLVDLSVEGLSPRTRSKFVKQQVCKALGYPIPKSFKKTQPKFSGQNFDVYTQLSNNLQIWNEEIDENRRYVLVRVDSQFIIKSVRVITGADLVLLDRTGTLTRKYQATMKHFHSSRLFTTEDTVNINEFIRTKRSVDLYLNSPNDMPSRDSLLPIRDIFDALVSLEGMEFSYINALQDRNRGAIIHSEVCTALGYKVYDDNGQYPDLVNQLLEVKLQTSPTIDLGLHSPEDGKLIVSAGGFDFYSEDVRYAIFDASTDKHNGTFIIDRVYVTNGENFVDAFPLFKGKTVNAKLQIPLPKDFFD